MHSCLYHGFVRHRRFQPAENRFRFSLFQPYLDLDELGQVFDGSWLWSVERFGLAQFRRSDHFGDQQRPLKECVLEEVERQTGERLAGPVRLLTNLRYFGYIINPVSYFFCFDSTGQRVQAVLAEVTNTPWGERHLYVLPAIRNQDGTCRQLWNDKVFHVSPFMQMNQRYSWRMSEPGRSLFIHIENHVRGSDAAASERAGRDGTNLFDVTMRMRRCEITPAILRKTLLSQPILTARVAAAIYWQAFRLWRKGVPFVPHPKSATAVGNTNELPSVVSGS